MDLRRLADKGFLQRNFHIVAQVCPALAPAGRAALTSHHLAENIVEYVGKTTGRETTRARSAAIFKGGMAEAVIGRALLRVLEALIGLVDLLELVLAGLVAGVAVGVELHGELAERTLQFLLVRPPC